jgi:alpha-D-xyloside xylohydrolase
VYDWTKGFQDEMTRLGTKPGEYFLLSRNGWAGTASHGAALWSGDISSKWRTLHDQVKVGQGVGMSGIPLWTTDIGGYSGGDPNKLTFQNLVVRWFQVSGLQVQPAYTVL